MEISPPEFHAAPLSRSSASAIFAFRACASLAFFSLLLDYVFRRPRNEIGVAELFVDARDVRIDFGHFLC